MIATASRRLCLLIAAMACASAVSAQSLLDRSDPRELQGREAERELSQYIGCIARTQRGKARRLLELPYLGDEQRRAATDIMLPACVGRASQLRFHAPNVVGRIAEVLFLDGHAELDVSRFAGLSDEAAAAAGLAPRNNAEDLALCTLRADPHAVRALIATRWESPEEAAAIQRLIPHLGPCLPAGDTLDLNARALRLLLAVALYRAATVAG
jgi:hypothetical protein